ncbi:MAG: type II secretion system F family protein [Bryobacteraceae bacterium]
MQAFHFKAVAADGKLRTGNLHGESEKSVARELRKQGLNPVFVGLEPQKPALRLALPEWNRGKSRDVLFFTQEMATLLSAGVPLDRALGISTELTDRPAFRLVVQDILRILKGGRSLADSLAQHPKHFSDLYVNMIRAGEAAGTLEVIFERLSEFEKSRDELRGYIISSMVYPGLLTAVGFGSILVLLQFVVPRFATVFEESNMKMPLAAQLMMAASDGVRTFGPFLFGGGVLAALGLRAYIGIPQGRMWWDTLRLKAPMLGDALRKAETARFARAMATLVANSVPLVQSIGISAAILNNKRIAGALEGVAQGVKRGEGIAGPVTRAACFPPLAGHLLSVGEETGRLDQMFARMAEIYEADTKASIRRFTSLFEPVVILVMGILVGGLILSILLAITSINEVAL